MNTQHTNLRVESIQGKIRVMEAVGRRIISDEYYHLIRIENDLREMLKTRTEEDKKMILKIKDGILGNSTERSNGSNT